MKSLGKSEQLVNDAGCGMFQVLVAGLTYVLMKHPASYSMVFMSFGNYNPGWRCLDDSASSFGENIHLSLNTSSWINITDTVGNTNKTVAASGYSVQSCDAYKKCQSPEFDPEVSTVVTEWKLVCDRDWISSLMISLQMIGILIGSFVTGQLGDWIGRKKTIYACLALAGVFNICASFATHWQLFAVFRFFIGFTLSGVLQLYFTLPNEFLTSVWRARVVGLPAWHTGSIIFALLAMWSQDWKTLQVIGGVMCLVCCVPFAWVPESMRWLEIKHKRKEFECVVRKVCAMSKNDLRAEDYLGLEQQELELPVTVLESNDVEIRPLNDNNKEQDIEATTDDATEKKQHTYTTLDLFRKDYRLYSILIAILWMSNNLIYYAITFGVKSMYGNLYVNMIILFGMEIPFSLLAIYVPNILGRQRGAIVFLAFTALFLLIASALEIWAPDSVRHTGTMVLAVLAKTAVNAGWYCLVSLTSELYPTVVRSIGLGYANVCLRLGGALAPVLIPRSAESIYICYIIMGVLSIVNCLLLKILPETKNRNLKETFDDKWD